MVDPIYLFAIAIAVGFLLSLIDKLGRNVSISVLLITLAYFVFLSASWFYGFYIEEIKTIQIFTAGVKPPYSINLQIGLEESLFMLLINGVGFLSALYLTDRFKKDSVKSLILLLMAIMGFNGIVMTRDLFNLFVFIEVASIAVYALVAFDKTEKSLSAGFKYLIAGGLASTFLLIGTIYLYRLTGTLNLNGIGVLPGTRIAGVAVFFLFISLVIELKPFPANGWALDVYEAVNPGIAAVISGASVAASFFALYKILPIFGDIWYPLTAWLGIITFVGSNYFAIKQGNARRLLGYSSLGQVGLMMTILGLSKQIGSDAPYILLGVLLSHYFAKIGLFWIAGLIKKDKIESWAVLNKSPWMLFLMGTFLFALVGMPPFPSFFAKWSLVMKLSSLGMFGWIAFLLLGSFLEALYLFRWFGYAVKLKSDDAEKNEIKFPLHKLIPIAISALALYLLGWATEGFYNTGYALNYIPLLFIAVIFLLDFLPNRVKAVLSMGAMAYYAFLVLPLQSDYALIFNSIFLIGGLVNLIATFATGGQRKGFFPLALLMFLGLSGLTETNNMLGFFISWEFMTIGSYLLIIRGKKAMPHALSYLLFSLGGAYLILFAFAIVAGGSAKAGLLAKSDLLLANLSNVSVLMHPYVWGLLIVGFLTKAAGFGLHIWLPGAHSEAESDVSPLVSAILLKAGIFGLILTMIYMGGSSITTSWGVINFNYILGWLGAITAVIGTMGAIFQEDAKRLLAYSSIGQLGYIIFAVALMTKLGWMMAILYSVLHFLYKSTLFLGVGGMYQRTHTKNMYEMGGLIKKMPFTFVSVLIAIIALAGIPPLVGFGGKWFAYNATLDSGWYLQGVTILFAGFAAFLYSFRILHAPFLGQPKDKFRNVKEANIFMLIPQYIFIIALLYLSVFPQKLLAYVSTVLSKTAVLNGEAVSIQDGVFKTSYGYWNPMMIMIVIGTVFVLVFLWLYYHVHNSHKVKQFNIVYSGESPYRPETTHFAWNFFAVYRKGIGFLYTMLAERFWNWVSGLLHSVADFVRRVYTGNGQTYAMHIVLYVVVVYFFFKGGF